MSRDDWMIIIVGMTVRSTNISATGIMMPKIGSHLRELRRRRNLGIRAVAARSGLSHSTISLIERDRMSPSIDTLNAILESLGTTLTGFFLDFRPQATRQPFYRAADLVEIGRGDDISFRVVGADFPDRAILVMHERYAEGASTGEVFSHRAQECGIIVSGAIELTVGQQTTVLRTGDGYYFDSTEPHRFTNVFDGVSEIVSAVTPPTY